MEVIFKHPRTLDGKHFTKGQHVLPEELKGHWFFKALIAAGDVKLVEAPKPAPKKVEPPKAAEPQVEAPKQEAPAAQEEKAPSQPQEKKEKGKKAS